MSADASVEFENIIAEINADITQQMKSRGVRAAVKLRNAALETLRGQRTGRVYTVPYTRRKYTASAPGEPPAQRTGAFRMSWRERSFAEQTGAGELRVVSRIQSGIKTKKGHLLGDLLEDGHGHTLPRPYKQQIIKKATPEIQRIYKAPY